MTKLLVLFVTSIVAICLIPGCGEPETVTFPDENLDAAIRDTLGKPAGEEITVDELANLIILSAEGSLITDLSDITDLSGLKYCTNLTTLSLFENQISDVSPLSSLTNLTLLYLSGNQISDISPLSSLTNLTLLYLSGNQISDISPLSSLTNLTTLNLFENQINDISPLASLTNLTVLGLSFNQINDISALSSLTNLTTLSLYDNNLDLTEGSEDMENIKALEDRGVVVHYLIPTPTPFSMQVIPDHMEDTIAGQSCVFLVTIKDSSGGKAVNISAEADSQWWRENTTVTVNPQAIVPGQVAEVTVLPNERITGPLWVVVRGERDGLEQTETVTINVGEALLDPDGLALYATELRDKFIPWLATNHPEFGITDQTEWMPSIVRPHIMVVMYYLFFSEDWEMGLRWHVTIPPYDWVEIYLRHRTTEVGPSYAFKISSLEAQDEPQAVELEEMVWR